MRTSWPLGPSRVSTFRGEGQFPATGAWHRSPVLSVLAALALTLVGCEPVAPAVSAPTASHPQPQPDPCAEIAGTSFQSVKDLDLGLGRDGRPAKGKWRVAFHGQIMTLDSSDTRQSASFRCSNGLI